MSHSSDVYARATLKTFDDLKSIAASPKISALSRLSLPEIESLTEQIAQVVPAGNVPGLILGGLARLEGRHVPPVERQRHLDMLFRGVRDALDRAVYGAVFAGPAAILMGYQKLLQLAGQDVEAAFPEGTWQFYLQFALREDSARHANETTGFQHSLAAHRIALRDSDALTAWIMASILTVRQYDRLLENEWRERTATRLLQEVAMPYLHDADLLTRLQNSYRQWESQRPYVRGHDAGDADYPDYRRRQFDLFFQPYLEDLPVEGQEAFEAALSDAESDSLPAYQRQMTILAQLSPDLYRDERVRYTLEQSSVAVVYKANYVLIPLASSQASAMPDVESVRALAARLLSLADNGPTDSPDLLLAEASRSAQAGAPKAGLRALPDAQAAVSALAHTPIILNWDQCDARLPLTAIRQGHRGVGDHALTLFFTPESTVFDQSHIFFDGTWGAALAEIMTGEALSWALYLAQLPAPKPGQQPISLLPMAVSDRLREAAAQARLKPEASAESTAIRLGPVMALRRLFKTRNDLLNLTVNDLLIVYRALHGRRYQPLPTLRRELEALWSDAHPESQQIYKQVYAAIEKIQQTNPAILIPMDASQHSPRERLYPTTFRNPMTDLLDGHDSTLAALHAYQNAQGDRSAHYADFDQGQRQYLRMLAGFAELMRKYRDIALSGQSTSTASIKMLANFPVALQMLLDQIPGQFDVLNEIIKGEEVFSNVGRVSKGSTLRRFMTAKDDNHQKTLAWGVLTDDQDTVHVSLRDFRPHVAVLTDMGKGALAHLIAQDFLDSYTDGFNLFIRELREITFASRETRVRRDDGAKEPDL